MDRRAFLIGGAAALAAPRWASAQEVRVDKNLEYGDANGYKLQLDLYRPAGPGPHPVIALVHGGGWIGGHRSGYEEYARVCVSRGYAAAAVGYRLGPQYPYPAAFDDCQRAIRWLRANSKQYDLDPKRVAALGGSAGGHLVALIGVRGKTRDNSDKALAKYSSRPDAVVPVYGCFELIRMWDIEMAHKPMTAWLGGPPWEHKKTYHDTSPTELVTRKTPPMLLIHGDADKVNPLEQSQLMFEALRKKDVPCELLVIPGAGHGWAQSSDFAKKADAATFTFLEKHLPKR